MKPYFICATPRTGTNLFCEALRATKVAGDPDEYFGHMHVPRWKKKWKVERTDDYLSCLTSVTRSENGLWGVKVMMQYFDDLYTMLLQVHEGKDINRFEIIERTFGEANYIWMTRRDKIAQAISLHKAYQNFVWSASKETSAPDESELVYDYDEINRILFEIIKNESEWEEYFQAVGRRPYVIIYEDFVEDYKDTINRAINHLEINYRFEGKIEDSLMKKQSNRLSREWKKRFLEERNLPQPNVRGNAS